VYVNLCVEMKRYIDSTKDANVRKELLTYYDGMVTTPDIDAAEVTKEDFVEIVTRSHKQHQANPRDMSVLSRFRITKHPPPKESLRCEREAAEQEENEHGLEGNGAFDNNDEQGEDIESY
jgi:hypothetical protein